MRLLLFSILLLFISKPSFCIQSWEYKKTKNGITLIADGGYEDSIGNQRMYDAFLDLLAEKTKGSLRGYKILLLFGQPGISLSSYQYWSATIAFDTLRNLDTKFIKDYADFKESRFSDERFANSNLPAGKFMFDLPEPIDINSTFDTTANEVGLKIIYHYGENDSNTVFDRIFTLVNYGIENFDKIRNQQKRITLISDIVKIRVSMVTIDTGLLKSLPIISSGFDYHIYSTSYINSSRNEIIRKLVVGFSLIILLAIYFITRQRLD